MSTRYYVMHMVASFVTGIACLGASITLASFSPLGIAIATGPTAVGALLCWFSGLSAAAAIESARQKGA